MLLRCSGIHLVSKLIDKGIHVLHVVALRHTSSHPCVRVYTCTTKVLVHGGLAHAPSWLARLVKHRVRANFELVLHLGHHRLNHSPERRVEEHVWEVNDLIGNVLS